MATQRYEISLRVLKNILFTHEEQNFGSPGGHELFYLLYKHKEILNQRRCIVEAQFLYVTITTVTFLLVEILHVFALKLIWYLISVLINR